MRIPSLFAALAAVMVLVCAAPASALISQIGRGTAVTVGTTATALDDTSVSNSESRYIVVCNPGDSASTIYVGGDATVTVSNGTPVKPGACYSTGERVTGATPLYGIASASTPVRVQEIR